MAREKAKCPRGRGVCKERFPFKHRDGGLTCAGLQHKPTLGKYGIDVIRFCSRSSYDKKDKRYHVDAEIVMTPHEALLEAIVKLHAVEAFLDRNRYYAAWQREHLERRR